jgi:hypothetical protein
MITTLTSDIVTIAQQEMAITYVNRYTGEQATESNNQGTYMRE